ncbi:hypothetical protein DFH09DRAFT_1276648 [Mycena vulgaris]|nr:hypothetical protein DFH09DRAFT_1276648 [Mycena vulgaris]
MTLDPQLPACRFGACISASRVDDGCSLRGGAHMARGTQMTPQRLREGVQSVDCNGATTGSGWVREAVGASECAREDGDRADEPWCGLALERERRAPARYAFFAQRRLQAHEDGKRRALLPASPVPSLSTPPLLPASPQRSLPSRVQAHENGLRSSPSPPHPLPSRVRDMPEHRLRAHENGGFASSLHPPSFHSLSRSPAFTPSRVKDIPAAPAPEREAAGRERGERGRDNARGAGEREQPGRVRARLRGGRGKAREGEEGSCVRSAAPSWWWCSRVAFLARGPRSPPAQRSWFPDPRACARRCCTARERYFRDASRRLRAPVKSAVSYSALPNVQ